MNLSRRQFLDSVVAAGAAFTAGAAVPALSYDSQRAVPNPTLADKPSRKTLAERFPDLRRHFVFEYYPWYQTNPYGHWNEAERQPPVDLASTYMPQLGAYDSGSTAVMEQHARWIAAAGVGAINVSWWGRDSERRGLVSSLMDVMRAYDVHVTFHIEPYADDRALRYASDIQYLMTEYGDRRHWDCFLLLQHEDGAVGPVFKSFDTILPQQYTDCHGKVFQVSNYTADEVWRRQTDQVRKLFAGDFDRLTLLADSVDHRRVLAAGFDGIAIYDNNIPPDQFAFFARESTLRNLVFSFNCNPGFDGLALRHVDPDACYTPPRFQPGNALYDWAERSQREAAAEVSIGRIVESFNTTVAVQTAASSANAQRGFFLTYINSFNEWHEGHQFEPMKNAPDLTAAERAIGYHNPDNGRYRMDTLATLVRRALAG
jgi:hypothetical protein